MAHASLPHDLAFRGDGGGTIIMLVMDGLGGLPHPDTGRTELESAATPHLDELAARSSLGMLAPVGQGITPGSGPGHLALFGYDPIESMIGRGVLSALGVGVELHPGDVAARLNLATVDRDGVVTDRRAGRPSDEEGRRVIEAVRTRLRVPTGVEVTLVHEKEHRAVLVLRGEGLGAGIADTDPQRTGLPAVPATPTGSDPQSEFIANRNLTRQAGVRFPLRIKIEHLFLAILRTADHRHPVFVYVDVTGRTRTLTAAVSINSRHQVIDGGIHHGHTVVRIDHVFRTVKRNESNLWH